MKLLVEITDAVRDFALDLLEAEGYKPFRGEITLSMSVHGYHQKYDGWDVEVSEAQWKEMLSLDLTEEEVFVIEKLRDLGNQPEEAEKLWSSVSPYATKRAASLNQKFKTAGLPYHLGQTAPLGYFRLVIRPAHS